MTHAIDNARTESEAPEELRLHTERIGAVGVIELARPKTFNCLSTRTFEEIEAALEWFERDASVRAVLLRSQGKNFCTGADLTEVKGARSSREELRRFLHAGHAVLSRLEASSLPVVAAVQGLCLAGGLELMLACDVVFAQRTAKFGDQHAQFGLVPGWGGSQRLTRAIGLRRSLDLQLSARWIDAESACSWGLVNYVCEEGELNQRALEYCQRLATRSRVGLARAKTLAREGQDMSLAAGLALEEREALCQLITEDVAEGVAAFEQRRSPVFF